MAAKSVNRQFIDILQRLLDIVGVECSQGAHLLYMVTAQGQDICQGTQHDSKVAMIGRHFREELLQSLTHTDGTAARTTAAMRRRECLVQIDVHHVETHITWTTSTQHGVQIGSVVVHQSTTSMNQLGNFRNLSFEESQRIRIGHHHGCDAVAAFRTEAAKVFQIHQTVGTALYLQDFQATDGSRSRIGTMSRVGYDHLLALHVLARAMVVVNDHQARQLTMGTSIGLEGEMSQARQCTKHLLQHHNSSLCALGGSGRLQRMQVLKLRKGSHFLVDLGIVLHGTRTQRIETAVYTKVIL